MIPVISRASQKAEESQDALANTFHDIDLIWDIRNNQGFKQQYFCIQRPRLLYHWTERNQALYFPNNDYDYSHYKMLWWEFLQQEDFFILLKFGNVNTAIGGRPPI